MTSNNDKQRTQAIAKQLLAELATKAHKNNLNKFEVIHDVEQLLLNVSNSPLNPVEAIESRRLELGLIRDDLIPYFGDKGKVSVVMNYKRKLSINMIRKINVGLKIPFCVLLQQYELAEQPGE
ncbi:MAG: hypothetical protein HAW67_01255 [Endozoicomonadaceae bacterium]|nr:hypothetical protein [Endozoicomonadaceae bacterium]